MSPFLPTQIARAPFEPPVLLLPAASDVGGDDQLSRQSGDVDGKIVSILFALSIVAAVLCVPWRLAASLVASYVPIEAKAFVLLSVATAGFIAQLVDGALGMVSPDTVEDSW